MPEIPIGFASDAAAFASDRYQNRDEIEFAPFELALPG
jgi:hypothetical protein